MMDLDFLIKVVGWSFTIGPVAVFLVISSYMVAGAAKDDEAIMAMVMAGMGAFGVGVCILIVMYLTSFSINNIFVQ